ncbi:MAG: hypothetical protein IKD36_00870 [Clostridia bacterium]|nr:hypothetical protein [Clostridia bacterium]
MKFEVKKLEDKKVKYFEINEKTDFKASRQEIVEAEAISIDFDYLNLGEKLYGNSRKSSKLIQKKNCAHIIKVFKHLKKMVKMLKKTDSKFDGVFYVKGLDKKKNNNDLMIVALLDTALNFKPHERLGSAVNYACDYLDKENTINNMCDFKDNKCIKHREKKIDKATGCCPPFCKYTECKTCTVKNLSCKLFMCDYLEDRGYIFSPHTVPVLKRHLNWFERFMSIGLLFKTTKKTIKCLWAIRILLVAYLIVFVGLVSIPFFV